MKNILITGGSGVIGKEIITSLHQLNEEVNLIFTSRSEKNIEEIESLQINRQCIIKGILMNHSSNEDARKLIAKCKDLNLAPQIIINNARDKNNLQVNRNGLVDEENWIKEFKIGITFPYFLVMEAFKKLDDFKRVINIGSIYGINAPNLKIYENPLHDSPIHYGVIKAGLHHLTKELAVRLSSKVSVNCIAYGGIDSSMKDKNLKRNYQRLCPFGRPVFNNEVSSIIKFLAFEAPDSLTGTIIPVDGGWTAQ